MCESSPFIGELSHICLNILYIESKKPMINININYLQNHLKLRYLCKKSLKKTCKMENFNCQISNEVLLFFFNLFRISQISFIKNKSIDLYQYSIIRFHNNYG